MLVLRYLSPDGSTWSPPRQIGRFIQRQKLAMSAARADGRIAVACFTFKASHYGAMLREEANGEWERSPQWFGMPTWCATMDHHPRWGYVLAWRHPAGLWEGRSEAGPFLIRGPSLDGLFAKRAPTTAPSGDSRRVPGRGDS